MCIQQITVDNLPAQPCMLHISWSTILRLVYDTLQCHHTCYYSMLNATTDT